MVRIPRVRCFAAALLIIAIFCCAESVFADVTITALSVGNADAIVIDVDGRGMMIDTGKAGDWNTVLGAVAKYRRLEYVVLTHPHADHIGGFAQLAKSKDIGMVIASFAADPETKVYQTVQDAIERYRIPVWLPDVGDTFTLGDATFTVYAPHPVLYANLNDTSLVLMMEAYGTRALFLGDAEMSSEYDMLANEKNLPLKADVLKLGHHGKDTSSSVAFIEAVSPSIAIVSTATEPDGDVVMALFEAGVEDVLSTAEGRVVVRIAEPEE